MKNPLILSLVALGFCAVALALTLLALTSSGSRSAASPAAAELHPDRDLLVRIEALAAENLALRERISMLEQLPVPVQRTAVTGEYVPRDEFDAFRDEVADALASGDALARSTPRESAEFKEQVASTLQELRKEETVTAIQRSLEKRAASLDRTMPRLENLLQLTPRQSEAMRSALLARYEREADLTRRWKEGEDPEILGEVKTNDFQTHREELSQILTPSQLDTYLSRGSGGGKGGGE